MPKYEERTKNPPTLDEMQEFVGGWIEMVTFHNGDQMIIDEEGKLKEKEVNIEATVVFQAEFGFGDVIVGDAVMLRGKARMK